MTIGDLEEILAKTLVLLGHMVSATTRKKREKKRRVHAVAKREEEEDSQGRRRSKGLREENQEKEAFLKPREANGLVFSWQLEVSRVHPSLESCC